MLNRWLKQVDGSPSVVFSIFVFIIILSDGVFEVKVAAVVIAEIDVVEEEDDAVIDVISDFG
jgi:hypothetical protein